MRRQTTLKIILSGVTAGLLTAGCADMNRFEAKLDMTAEHVTSPKPYYQGEVQEVRKIGAMTSIEFQDGRQFEVRSAPPGLMNGDVVRVFKVDDDYEAHLWRNAEALPPSAEANALAPATPAK